MQFLDNNRNKITTGFYQHPDSKTIVLLIENGDRTFSSESFPYSSVRLTSQYTRMLIPLSRSESVSQNKNAKVWIRNKLRKHPGLEGQLT